MKRLPSILVGGSFVFFSCCSLFLQAEPQTDTTTATVGGLQLADVNMVILRGPHSPFTYTVPTYGNQSSYDVHFPFNDDGRTITETRHILNEGGQVTAPNVAHVNLRFTFAGWAKSVVPGGSVVVTVGAQTGTAPFGASELVIPNVPHASLPFSITITGAQTTNGKPTPLPVPGLLPIQVASPIVATLRPHYYLLTVLYAPPGTNGGKSSSQVDYATGSSTGTITSNSQFYSSGLDMKAEVGGGLFGGPTITADFAASNSTTDQSSVEVKKTQTGDFRVVGPATDGINHNSDIFVVWLNPSVNVSIEESGAAHWQLAVDGPKMQIQTIYAAWLKNPAQMAADNPGLKADLDAAGLTQDDYQGILSADPFVFGATRIDPNRFLPVTQTTFSYNPPLSQSDAVPARTYSQSNSLTTTAQHSVELTTKVGLGISVSVGSDAFIKAKMSLNANFQWTNKSSTTNSSGSSQSASFTIGGPAFGYKGPVDIAVYWDTVYNSFMFAFATNP